MYSCGEIGGGEIGEVRDVAFDEGVTADNLDYLRDSFECIGANNWNKLSLSERMDALRLLETRTAELERRHPRAVVCEKMNSESYASNDTIHVNADHMGMMGCRESILKPFSFKGRSVAFRGDFGSLMKDVKDAIADTKKFVKSQGKTFTWEGYIERGVQSMNKDRERLNDWVERQKSRPVEELRQDLNDAAAEQEMQSRRSHENEIYKDQLDLELSSFTGKTLDQINAIRAGYEQVHPQGIYEWKEGNPNLFTKNGKLYELLPSGNLYEVCSDGSLDTNSPVQVRK